MFDSIFAAIFLLTPSASESGFDHHLDQSAGSYAKNPLLKVNSYSRQIYSFRLD
jgi:hypothetical protein